MTPIDLGERVEVAGRDAREERRVVLVRSRGRAEAGSHVPTAAPRVRPSDQDCPLAPSRETNERRSEVVRKLRRILTIASGRVFV